METAKVKLKRYDISIENYKRPGQIMHEDLDENGKWILFREISPLLAVCKNIAQRHYVLMNRACECEMCIELRKLGEVE